MKQTKIKDDAQMRDSGLMGREADSKGKKSFVSFCVSGHQSELVLICLERNLMPAFLLSCLAAVSPVSCLDCKVMTELKEGDSGSDRKK